MLYELEDIENLIELEPPKDGKDDQIQVSRVKTEMLKGLNRYFDARNFTARQMEM